MCDAGASCFLLHFPRFVAAAGTMCCPALCGGGRRSAGRRCPLARAGLRRDAFITARPGGEAVSIMPDAQAWQRLFGWVRAAGSAAWGPGWDFWREAVGQPARLLGGAMV